MANIRNVLVRENSISSDSQVGKAVASLCDAASKKKERPASNLPKTYNVHLKKYPGVGFLRQTSADLSPAEDNQPTDCVPSGKSWMENKLDEAQAEMHKCKVDFEKGFQCAADPIPPFQSMGDDPMRHPSRYARPISNPFGNYSNQNNWQRYSETSQRTEHTELKLPNYLEELHAPRQDMDNEDSAFVKDDGHSDLKLDGLKLYWRENRMGGCESKIHHRRIREFLPSKTPVSSWSSPDWPQN